MATATTTTKAGAKKAPAKKAPAKRQLDGALPDAARDIEHALTAALHRDLKATRKLLATIEKDLRNVGKQIEKSVQDLAKRAGVKPAAKKAPAKKAPAKKAVAKKAPAKKAPVKKAAAKA